MFFSTDWCHLSSGICKKQDILSLLAKANQEFPGSRFSFAITQIQANVQECLIVLLISIIVFSFFLYFLIQFIEQIRNLKSVKTKTLWQLFWLLRSKKKKNTFLVLFLVWLISLSAKLTSCYRQNRIKANRHHLCAYNMQICHVQFEDASFRIWVRC